MLQDEEFVRLFRRSSIALVFFVVPWLLGVPWYKAVVIAIVTFLALRLQIAARVVHWAALALVAYGLAYWIGAVPSPASLQAIASRWVEPHA
jgi:hypothetical protein